MEKQTSLTYSGSGVDIDAANLAKARIKTLVRQTFNSGVLSEVGLFGGLFRLESARYRDPVLVASADGVGTKLKVAFLSNNHRTVGYDLVSHCVNDILVQGAIPLFFLDYLACGKMNPAVVEEVVSGLVNACRETGCALIGGETAEMPDFYPPGEYDLAGFIVGVVEKDMVLDGSAIQPGDVVLGLSSDGLHTNGYSLARKLFFDQLRLNVASFVPELGCTVGEELLKPHRCYLKPLSAPLREKLVHGLAHITGGGLLENIPRILPGGCGVDLDRGSWEVPAVYRFMAERGRIPEEEMFRVFNMGIGMTVIVPPDAASAVAEMLAAQGQPVNRIGRVVAGEQTVRLKP